MSNSVPPGFERRKSNKNVPPGFEQLKPNSSAGSASQPVGVVRNHVAAQNKEDHDAWKKVTFQDCVAQFKEPPTRDPGAGQAYASASYGKLSYGSLTCLRSILVDLQQVMVNALLLPQADHPSQTMASNVNHAVLALGSSFRSRSLDQCITDLKNTDPAAGTGLVGQLARAFWTELHHLIQAVDQATHTQLAHLVHARNEAWKRTSHCATLQAYEVATLRKQLDELKAQAAAQEAARARSERVVDAMKKEYQGRLGTLPAMLGDCEIVCRLCRAQRRNAMVVPCRHAHFCWECLAKYAQTQSRCPSCGDPILGTTHFFN